MGTETEFTSFERAMRLLMLLCCASFVAFALFKLQSGNWRGALFWLWLGVTLPCTYFGTRLIERRRADGIWFEGTTGDALEHFLPIWPFLMLMTVVDVNADARLAEAVPHILSRGVGLTLAGFAAYCALVWVGRHYEKARRERPVPADTRALARSLSPEQRDTVLGLLQQRKKLHAVKYLHDAECLKLREAKDVVEYLESD